MENNILEELPSLEEKKDLNDKEDKELPKTSKLEKNKIENDFQKINSQFGSFILSKEAISRLYKIDSNLKNKNYILLQGPTGSSKTKTIQIYCKLKGLELIQFNMSGETTEEDLKGRILSDSKSFSGLKFKKGYFSEAFINGKILLLDEINLANQSVLNFIANALDSKLIMLEQDENENGSHIFQMHENFRLIATHFLGKREELPKKLLQEFNIIDFPSLFKNELKYIVKEIANNNKYEDLDLIDKITELHYDWSKLDESKVSPQLFTIRDIKNVINAISKEKPYKICDALMCFYGM